MLTRDSTSAPLDVPVLIIGGGPTGLLQSYLLARLGVRNLVVERYPERLGAPKAHAINPRSLEICRQFGLDTKEIRRLGTQRKDAFWVNFLTNLSGERLGLLPYERMDAEVLDDTPEMIHNIPQPVLEQFFADHLAKEPNSNILKGASFVSLQQDEKGVVTTIEERATGQKFTVQSNYVVACDGARSKVRDFLQIDSVGDSTYETMMTIHFSANLREVVGDRVGMLHWLFDPLASGFIIAYDLSGNAVLISNFDSSKHPVESWSEELCKQILTAAVGKDISPRILSYRPWLFSRRMAKSYRSNHVFLAGDAAHSFPPTGGLGLNSGLGDVHNLAFKLAAVYHGHASDSLLDSYYDERSHVAEINSMQSVKNGKQIFSLLKTLGTAGISDLQQARANLFATIHDPDKREAVDEGVEGQREHFDNLNLHIGYVYGDSSIPAHASHFTPQFIAGARLPHAWITPSAKTRSKIGPAPIDVSYVAELSTEETEMRQYSTLDLCAPDAFTFILPESCTGLLRAVTTIEENCFKPTGGKLKINIYQLEVDFSLVTSPRAESWRRDSGLSSNNGLLVRPDQHILFCLSECSTDIKLKQVLDQFLGL